MGKRTLDFQNKTFWLLCWAILLNGVGVYAQNKLTYYQDVKPIIDEYCTGCHRTGQSAPFPLTSYEDVRKRASFISMVVETRYMPPWHADTSFGSFLHARVLSAQQITTIMDWAANGALRGEPTNTTETKALEEWPQPDMVLKLQKPFQIPGDNTEQYRIFALPTGSDKDLYLRGVGFMPDNKPYVHHSRLMLDTTHLVRPFDGTSVGESMEVLDSMNIPLYNAFWQGWVPGNYPLFYPEGVGKMLPKNTDIVINMHYAPSAKPEQDQSEVHLYFAKNKPRRLVETFVLDESWIVNGPFEIPPDTVITFYLRSPVVPMSLSLVSVLPHMHLLGTKFRCFAITTDGDMIPLINIPEWDFNWQQSYQFANLVKLPAGSVIYAEATFDNTRNNPRNPYFPPKTVKYGWGTKDEMMELIFEFLMYEPGDEYLDFYGLEAKREASKSGGQDRK
ncbi:MAG: hypothetical protein H6555_01260 [Lewinellaceae bacterium]|nr:hypothetical protein [Lewinellaceae bacterium]